MNAWPGRLAIGILLALLVSACGTAPVPARSTAIPTPAVSTPPSASESPAAAPAAAPENVYTQTPTLPSPTAIDTPAPAAPSPTPTAPARAAFLVWPLPPSIGPARISQFPNTPWTWNYLGLNPGYACPPMFGYLEDWAGRAYWRDEAIPEAQDRAQADPHQFEMVACYSDAGDEDGGEGDADASLDGQSAAGEGQPAPAPAGGQPAGARGHAGTDIKASPGTAVFAAADGKVQQWRDSGSNSMVVLKHCLGGAWDGQQQCAGGRLWYTTYMHIIPDPALNQENRDVARGAQLGTVYNQALNSHLHFEAGREQRSYANFANPWGADQAPWLGCLWLDQSLCPYPDPAAQHLAFTTAHGRLFVRQGAVAAEPAAVELPTMLIAPLALDIQRLGMWGEHLLALDRSGTLFAWEGVFGGQAGGAPPPGALPGGWTLVAEDVLEFQAAGERLAVLDRDKHLLVKTPGGEWLRQADRVAAFSVSGQRLGYLNSKGELYVKDGGLENAWVGVAKKVSAFQLVDNRIALVNQRGELFVNEGAARSEFERMAGAVSAFQVAPARLGAIDREGRLWVQAGNLRAEWVLQAEGVQAFQLADVRLVMLGADGVWRYKAGSVYQDGMTLPWAQVREVVLR